MANRRMFTKDILRSSAFLGLPVTARELYVQASMDADDRGFVNNIDSVARMIGSTESDVKALVRRKFILRMDKDLYLIKGWLMSNTIQPSRIVESKYVNYLEKLYYDENESYTRKITKKPCISALNSDYKTSENGLSTNCQQNVDKTSTNCRQNVDKLSTQDSIGKYRIGKNRIGKEREVLSLKDKDINSIDKPPSAGEPGLSISQKETDLERLVGAETLEQQAELEQIITSALVEDCPPDKSASDVLTCAYYVARRIPDDCSDRLAYFRKGLLNEVWKKPFEETPLGKMWKEGYEEMKASGEAKDYKVPFAESPLGQCCKAVAELNSKKEGD